MVVKNPQGHKIIDQAIAAVISGYADEALVTFPYHGLALGDYVYIVSDIDEYNGFWYVTPVNANTFKISEYSGAPFVEYYQDADIDYYQTQEHVWNSIFLPIVYKISNDKWPTNSVDTASTISSQADDNGYTVLTLSAPTGASYLEYVQIADSTVDGVYQVIEATGSLLTINLPYDADNIFGTAQKYYNNYQTKVKIYAGLDSSHPWASKKPYELVGELSLTPDTDNITTFSVSDYIRNKIQIKNNTILFSLPLNLDAFTGFYIETAESFDSSDNYVLYTDESEFEVDDFEGYAIAGKLPFKNVYSGDYADYVWTDGSPALWLSTLSRLLAVAGRYFDLSFILNHVGAGSPGFTPDHTDILSFWGISNTSSEPMIWTGGIANPFCTISAGVSAGGLSDYFRDNLTFEPGQTYKYSYTMDLSADFTVPGNVQFRIHLAVCDLFNNILDEFTDDQTVLSTFPTGSSAGTFEFVCPVGADRVGFFIEIVNGTTDDALVTITSFTDETETIPASEAGTFDIVLKKYISSDYYLTETVEYQSQGIGVYRIPLIPDSQYIKYCIKAKVPGNSGTPSEETSVDDFPDLALFVQTGSGASWILGAAPTVTNPGAGFPGVSSKILYADYSFIDGYTYKITTNYTKDYNSGTSNPRAISISSRNSANTIIETLNHATFASPGGTESFDFTFVATSTTTRLALFTTDGSNIDLTINSIEATQTNPEIPATNEHDITEEICVDIIEECDVTSGFMPEEIRLLEDGDYRLLE